MKVRLLFFAVLRDRLKRTDGYYEILPGETVSQLAHRILTPVMGEKPFEKSLMFAANNQYVPRDYLPQEGEEIALIPPVAGG